MRVLFKLALVLFFTIQFSAAKAQFSTSGSCIAQSNSCYSITQLSPNQIGGFHNNTPISLTQPFSYKFNVNMGDLDANGADGIVFVLYQNLNQLIGIGGEGMAYQTINNSIGIEFDTWQNGNLADPTNDHIAIVSNGVNNHNSANNLAGPTTMAPGVNNVEDGSDYLVEITWNPTTQTLKVFWECVERLSYTGNIAAQFFNGNTQVYWGWVGSTGGSVNNQTVCLVGPSAPIVHSPIPDTLICRGTPVTINQGNGNSNYNYLYDPSVGNNVTTPTFTVAPYDTVTYNLTITQQCDTALDTFTIYTYPAQLPNLPATVTFCQGDSVLLNAYNPLYSGYTWNNNSTDSAIYIYNTGTYFVDAVDSNGCSNFGVTAATVINTASIDLGPDTFFCSGDSVLLSSPFINQAAYLWSTGAVTNSIYISQAGQYLLQVSINGCSSYDTISVVENQSPQLDLGPPITYCTGTLAQITANASGSYLWNTGSTNQTLLVNDSGLYICTVTATNGCIAVDSVQVNQVNPPFANLGPDQQICTGGQLILQSVQPAGMTFNWNTGETQQAIQIFQGGTYWVEVSNGACSHTDTIVITELARPVVEVTGPTEICENQTLTLTASANTSANFGWSTGASGTAIQVAAPGTYTVTASNLCGSNSASITVNNTNAPVDALPDTVFYCAGDTLDVVGIDYTYTYAWNYTDTSASYQVYEPGFAYVWVSNGCQSNIEQFAILPINCVCLVDAPKVFTPNSDGNNDVFALNHQCTFSEYNFEIFDRWGKKVFQSNNEADTWDGTLNGTKLDEGVYFWVLRYVSFFDKSAQKSSAKGTITLLSN